MERLRNVRLFLLDMDGTLYLGERLFEYTPSFLNAIRDGGKRYLFITNNSSKSVSAYVEKLRRLGIEATQNDFLTSSQATAYYLKHHYADAILYVCGTQSLKEELAANGFVVTENAQAATCIVMGFDTELTFEKLENVCRELSLRDIPYIATNPDWVCPTEFGSVPDCGSVCEMVYNATGKRPVFIGKPSPLMIQLAMEKHGISQKETAVIGDRIYTDIKSALNAGVLSVLVMSGETTEAILSQSPDKPDLVLPNVGSISSLISQGNL